MAESGRVTRPGRAFCSSAKTGGAGPAEAVNGLVGVADDEERAARLGPVQGEGALQGVDVLKLVGEQVGEAAVLRTGLRQGVEQQIVEVAQAQAVQPAVVGGAQGGIFLVRLGAGDGLQRRLGAQAFANFGGGFFGQGQRFGSAHEGFWRQHGLADGVEGADGEGGGGLFAQRGLHPGAEFGGGGAGEGDGGDLFGAGPARGEQPQQALHEGFGFAGARPGHHRHGGRGAVGGALLLFAENRGGRGGGGFLRFGLPGGRGGLGGALRRGGGEQRELAEEGFPLAGGEEGDDAVHAVVPRLAEHPALAQAADAFGQKRAAQAGEVGVRGVQQN